MTNLLLFHTITVETRQASTSETSPKATTPVIEGFPANTTVEEGHQVLFKVKVIGTPTPSYSWYHEGELVTDDYAHELKEDGSLLLVNVEEKQKGTYCFVANNDAGTVSQQVLLIVAVEGSDEAKMAKGDAASAKIGPIPVREFGEFVSNGHTKSNQGFKSQFEVSILFFSLSMSYMLFILIDVRQW